MKNHGMTMAFVASLAFIGSSMGCAVSSPAPSAPETSGETILMNEASQATLNGVEMRIERRAGESTFTLMEGSDWKIVAPGVWELASEDGNTRRVAVGEEGHRWLLEQADAELEVLYAQRDAEGANPELAQKIATAEELRTTAERSAESAVGGPSPQAVSCNLYLYTGPSSPVTNPPIAGAAALAQMVCGGGCVSFTVTSQACCAGSCSSVWQFTNMVCGTPWTAGTIRSGFGAGAAWVNVNPPNITQSSSSFFCQ